MMISDGQPGQADTTSGDERTGGTGDRRAAPATHCQPPACHRSAALSAPLRAATKSPDTSDPKPRFIGADVVKPRAATDEGGSDLTTTVQCKTNHRSDGMTSLAMTTSPSWPLSTIVRGLARSQRSRCRHGRGWCPWHARRPRRWDTRTNSGRRGCWPVIAASMARRRGTPAWPGSRVLGLQAPRRTGVVAAQGAVLPGAARSGVRGQVVGSPLCLSGGCHLASGSSQRRRGSLRSCSGVVEQTTPNVAFVSYDEKPSIQAISNTAPYLPPVSRSCCRRPSPGHRRATAGLS